MALAYGSATTQNSSGAGSYTFAHNVGSGSDRVLYVVVAGWANAAGDLPTGVTYAGSAMTLVADSGRSSGGDFVRIYRIVAPTANSNNVVVSMGGSSHLCRMVANHYTGAHQTTPDDGTGASATGTGTGPTVSVATDGTSDFALDGLAWDNSGGATATMTADTDRSQIQNSTTGGEGSAVSRDESAASSETMNWTLSVSSTWAMAGIGVRDTSSASDPTPTLFAAGAASTTNVSGAALTPALPAGWTDDDVVVILHHISANTTINTASLTGWTQLSAGNNTGAQRVEVYARRMVAGDTAPGITTTTGSTAVRIARCIGIRGVDPALDLATLQVSRSDNAASATITFVTITPTPATTLLLALYAYEDDPTAASQITDWTTFAVATTATGTDAAIGYASRSWPSASTATGALTSTASGGTFANSPNVGILLDFPPPSSGSASGSGGVSIGAPVLAASGTFSTTGSGALSIGSPVLGGSGTAFGPPISGDGDTTIGAPILAASGTFAVTGSGSITIAGAGLDASGTFATTGSGAVTIATPSVDASGTFTPAPIAGSGDTAIAAPIIDGSGEFATTGAGSLTVAAPVIDGSGTATDPGTGSGDVTIAAPVLAGTGTFAVTGTASLTIGGPALAGSGSVADPGTGSGALAIGGPSLSGDGTFTPATITGTGDTTIAAPVLAASGEVTDPSTGTGSVTIAGPSVSGAGTFATTGSGAVSIAAPIIDGSGSFLALISGTGAVTILGPTVTGYSVLATRATVSDAAYGTATASDAATVGAAAGDLALVGAAAGDSEA